MTEDPEKTAQDTTPKETAAPEAATPDGASPPEEEANGASGDALAAENADLKDRVLRAIAELENFRRRAEKERADTAKFAISGFARDMLNVLDNLRRGLDSVTAEDRKEHAALESLAAGMELTERELIAALERHGITRIEALGKPFDHDLHQAMFELDDPNQPAGICAQEMQPGYRLNERLLRPAMVGVTKGGPKAQPGAPDPVDAPIANEDLARAKVSGAAGGAGAAPGATEPGAGGDHDEGGQVDTKA
jgi:molecular chaperone GrpE